jgi:hypothetical protein
MKEQAQLREEMAYQYKIGNFEVRITNLSRLAAMLNHVLDFYFHHHLFIRFRLLLLFREGWTLMQSDAAI